MPSRRKIWSKVCLTVVVPAPEEPVTEMIGCFLLKGSAPEQAAPAEERGGLGFGEVVVGGDALHLLGRAEDEGGALVQARRALVEQPVAAVGGAAAGLLDQEGHRRAFVDAAEPAVLVAGAG